MPYLDALSTFYQERQRNQVHYLADIHQDNRPEEPDLNKYIDADVLGEICKNCKRRRPTRTHRIRAYRRV